MILGLGIDSVEIERFINWANLSLETLKKTLNPKEIDYCLEVPAKSAERFAARFAAKEAFFKAFSQMAPEENTPFLTICHNTNVAKADNGRPILVINWENILDISQKPQVTSHISITHTKNTATVIVILESL